MRDCSGAIAPIFALALPAVVLMIGVGLELALKTAQQSQLQRAVDAAALAAGKELGLSASRREAIPAVVETMVLEQFRGKGARKPEIRTKVSENPLQVEVQVRAKSERTLIRALGLQDSDLEASAVASIVGQTNVCVLALEDSEPGAIWMVKKSRMTGENCAIFSNSASSIGLAVRDGAVLKATTVCSAGGIEMGGTISPAGVTDCPTFEDPLASRPEPVVGACQFNNTQIEDATVTLTPGVYCGGLAIKGTSKVTLEPGTYIIQDGLFRLTDTASLQGDGAGFFLGKAALLFFGPETSIDLYGAKEGPLAGLLLFGSRSQSKLLTHTILSKNAQNLVGTIYLPRNSFIVDGDADVGGSSAYTAIVARRVVLLNGPNLMLHANYDDTDVPVPAGLRGAVQPVALSR
jgi:hypothetical protein